MKTRDKEEIRGLFEIVTEKLQGSERTHQD